VRSEFDVRVELAEVVTAEEVRAELAADPSHRLLRFNPRLRTNALGRAEVELAVPGPDVWTAVLTVMGVFGQAALSLTALHVEPTEQAARCSAA